MSLFGVLRLRLSQETAPNSAQDDEFNYENNFRDRTLGSIFSEMTRRREWLVGFGQWKTRKKWRMGNEEMDRFSF